MRLTVDRRRHDLDVSPSTTLAAALHDSCDVPLAAPCTDGTCGVCAVAVDGTVVRACLMLAVQCDGAVVVASDQQAA